MRMPEGRADPRVRRFLQPTRLLWQSNVGAANAMHVLDSSDSVCTLGPGGALLLDFGQELHGGIRLDCPTTSNGKPVRLRVRFGESASEAMGAPNQDHAIHDHEILLPWMGHTEVGCTGFRFVRLDSLESEATADLRRVEAVALYRDLPYLGSFECSDPLLNRIWETGAYTVHLCMQDHVWDGIKRDRLVWIGDMHPETLVIATVFGEVDVVPASLDYVRDRTPPTEWMNGISSYSLWWILCHHDWYRFHGRRAYLAEQISSTYNGSSIYFAAKKDKPEIAKDTHHMLIPKGPAGRFYWFETRTFAILKNSKNIPAAKEFLKWWFDEKQFGEWWRLQEGYMLQPVVKYYNDPVWQKDPKMSPFREQPKYGLNQGYAGPPNEKAALAWSKFIVVDTFAKAVQSGDAKASIEWGAEQLKRIYGGK